MNNSDVLALVAADNRARILEARRPARQPHRAAPSARRVAQRPVPAAASRDVRVLRGGDPMRVVVEMLIVLGVMVGVAALALWRGADSRPGIDAPADGWWPVRATRGAARR